MLEQMRRKGASVFIYLIFFILIAGMIYSLAPSGNRSQAGCSTSSNVVVSVDGTEASNSAYLVAYSIFPSSSVRGHERDRVYLALDAVIRRELLAQAAQDRGIRTSGEMIDDEIMHDSVGYFYLAGKRFDVTHQFFEDVNGKKVFRYAAWDAWVKGHDIQSPGTYRDEQARSMQAALMSEILEGSVRISREEALADYLYANDTVTYDVVTFDPVAYRSRLSNADTKRFLEGHAAEVEARYKTDERTYKGVKPQLAFREIFIPKALPEAAKPADKKPAVAAKPADDKAAKPADDKAAKPADKKPAVAAKPADDKAAKPADKKPAVAAKPADKKPDAAAKPADKKPAAGDAPRPYGLPIEAAKAKLEAARAAIAAGKLSFPDAENQLAADSFDDVPDANGDRGWRSADNPGFDEKAVNDAAKALKPGEMTPVIVTDRGTYLITATAKREGDLSFEQVKTEIASTLAQDVWSKEAAKRAALDALAKAQAGKTLEQLFEREPVRPDDGGLQELLQNPDIPDEEKQELLRQYFERQKLLQKHGALETHERDEPAAWYADADGSAAAASAGSAKAAPAAPAPAGSAKAAPAPAAGSAATPAGSAPATPAAGSAAPAAAAPAAAPPAAPAITASSDVLPQLTSPPKPLVKRFGPARRQLGMQGIAKSKEAAGVLFDELSPGHVAKRVFEGDAGSYVVVQLIERSQPKVDEFDKAADAEIARMQTARSAAAVHDWLRNRCEALRTARKIKPAADKIHEVDDKGNTLPTTYVPCRRFDDIERIR